MVKFLVTAIPAVLSVVIAIFSVQNATPISLNFLSAKTVQLSVGIWVALALGSGMLGTALLLGLFGKKKSKTI